MKTLARAVSAIALVCLSTSARADDAPPGPAASALAPLPDVRCAVDPGTYVIAFTVAAMAGDKTFDTSTPNCSTEWLRQASADMKDIKAIMDTMFAAGRAAGFRRAMAAIDRSTPAPAPEAPPPSPAAPLQGLAAGLSAFGQALARPRPTTNVTCISNRAGQQVYTTCR